MIPGEVDGMPRPLKRSGTHKAKSGGGDDEEGEGGNGASAIARKGWLKVRKALLGDVNADEDDLEMRPAASTADARSHEEGGPTNRKSVPVETSSGLRGTGEKPRPSRFEREAARLIRAHKAMQGPRNDEDAADHDPADIGYGPSLDHLARGGTINRQHLPESGASTPDALDTSARLDARPLGGGGGILGNLLMLYEQQQRELRETQLAEQSGSRTRVNSVATSEYSTPGGSNPLEVAVAKERSRAAEKQSPAPRKSFSLAAGRVPFRNPSPSHSPGVGKVLATGSKQVLGAAAKTVKVVANEAGLEDITDERPKAARSGGGIVGALVATTGNLIGAVSPNHAQLGPNPSRPGFTLDRYLLPEMNAKTLRKTAQLVADASTKPTWKSVPGTPRSRSAPTSPPNGAPGTMARSSISGVGGSSDHGGSGHASPEALRNALAELETKRAHGGGGLRNRRAFTGDKRSSGHFGGGAGAHGGAFHGLRPWISASAANTPAAIAENGGDYFQSATDDGLDEKLHKQEWQRKLKKRAKEKRRKEEIFVSVRVAEYPESERQVR